MLFYSDQALLINKALFNSASISKLTSSVFTFTDFFKAFLLYLQKHVLRLIDRDFFGDPQLGFGEPGLSGSIDL